MEEITLVLNHKFIPAPHTAKVVISKLICCLCHLYFNYGKINPGKVAVD